MGIKATPAKYEAIMTEDNSKKFGGPGIGGTDVQFQETVFERSDRPKAPGLIRLIINYSGGYIKNEKQANYAALGLAGLFLIITIMLLAKTFGA